MEKGEKIKISEGEFRRNCDEYCGCCLACGDWTEGGVEPDARGYECESCGEKKVYGAEELGLMGRIEFTEE